MIKIISYEFIYLLIYWQNVVQSENTIHSAHKENGVLWNHESVTLLVNHIYIYMENITNTMIEFSPIAVLPTIIWWFIPRSTVTLW